MNNVETRLRAAAEETRRLARERRPPELTSPSQRQKPGWLVFAAAFALVAVTFGILPLLIGNQGTETQPPGSSPVSTPTDTAPETVPTTTTPAEGRTCSSDGATTAPDTAGLPQEVAATLAAIVEAASACDLETLETLAADGFTTSFGGGGFDNLVEWEEEGEGKLGILLQILDLSHATIEGGDRGEIYVWPAAFAYETWAEIPEDLMDELRGIYTEEELDLISGLGSYGGWRTGIDQDGNWLFFVAGD